jgi:pimeloyl-ACP methyl ester carboxylesterase
VSDDGTVVYGGRGGVVATTDEMVEAARALARARDALDEARRACAVLVGRVEATRGCSGVTADRALAQLSRLVGHHGTGGASELAESRAGALRVAAQEYLTAESRALNGLTTWSSSLGTSLGENPITWPLLALRVCGYLKELLRRELSLPCNRVLSPVRLPTGRETEGVVAGLAAFLVAAPPGRTPDGEPVEIVAGALGRVVGAVREIEDPTAWAADLTVTPVSYRPDDEPVTGVVDAMELLAAQSPSNGAAQGQVAIQEREHADGSRSWVVAVPGTQGGGPINAASNLAVVAGTGSTALGLVARAMTQAGIRPGEPVTMVGHSQGGMVAAQLAADPLLRTKFTVTTLITAGSPVGNVDLPPWVSALHLEHTPDGTPGLEATPNPDTLNRTTVLVPTPDGVERVDATSDYPRVHEVDQYVATARALPTHDSVAGFEDALRAALGTDVVRASTWEYQGVLSPPSGVGQ